MAGQFELLFTGSFSAVNTVTVTHNLDRLQVGVIARIGNISRNDLIKSIVPLNANPRNAVVVTLDGAQTGEILISDTDYVFANIPTPEAATAIDNATTGSAFSGSFTSTLIDQLQNGIFTGSFRGDGSLLTNVSGGGGADDAASYLVLSTTASLSNERAFTPSTGLSAVDGGANGAYTLSVNDSVVATISGSTFTGAVSFDQGLSGSLTQLTDGTSYFVAGNSTIVTSASNGAITVAANVRTGKTLWVDSVYGNDGTATNAITTPYKTIHGAMSSSTYHDVIMLLPGEHTVTASIDMEPGVGLVGLDRDSCVIYGKGPTAYLVNMASGSTLANVVLRPSSSSGILFAGTTSAEASAKFIRVEPYGGDVLFGVGITGTGQPLVSSVNWMTLDHCDLSTAGFSNGLSIASTGTAIVRDVSAHGLVGAAISAGNHVLQDCRITGIVGLSIAAGAITRVDQSTRWVNLTNAGTLVSDGEHLTNFNTDTTAPNFYSSGVVTASLGLSGSLTRLVDGSSYLAAGSNVTITSASNGQVVIASTGGGTAAPDDAQYLTLATDASLSDERVFTPGTGLAAVDAGANAAYTLSVNDSVVATISGSTFTGAVSFDQGLSGSLTRLVDGTSYLIAGTGVTLASASNGAVTISAPDVGDITGVTAGTGLTGGGTSGTVTLDIDDSVVATVSGTAFTGDVRVPNLYSSGVVTASLGLSGSLTRLIDDTSYLVAGAGVAITSASNGQVTIFSNDLLASRTRFVDPDGIDTTGAVPTRGTATAPYKTIQFAVDDIEANLSPSSNNPAGVVLNPGIYDERVFILKSGVGLWGRGGQGLCQIKPTVGSALVVSNATSASLATYVDGGAYSGLVNDGAGPKDSQFRNIDFYPQDGTSPAVQLIGVKGDVAADTTSFGSNELDFFDCTMRTTGGALSLYARNANYVTLNDGCWAAAPVTMFNVAGLWNISTTVSDLLTLTFNTADSEGYASGGNYGLRGSNSKLATTILSGTTGTGELIDCTFTGPVTVKETANFNLSGGGILGDVTVEAAGTFIGEGIHIQGDPTFSAGSGVVSIDGGEWSGTLTDPSSRLTHNNGPAGGDLAGTMPNPAVSAITETGGPTQLTLGAVADGEFLVRSGGTLVGGAGGGGGADDAASYLVLSATASLSNERAFTPSTGLTAVDGGSGGAYTLSINDSVVATVSGSTFTGDVRVPNLYSSGVVTASLGFSGSLTQLVDGSSYIVGGNSITVASASNGAVTISAAGIDVAALQIVDSPAPGAAQTMTATIPPDDTIPQNTEGTQILSASLTPLNPDSKLHVNVVVQYTMSTTNVVTVALFRDSEASAIATVMSSNDADHMSVVNFSYVADSNATTSTEFKVRIGPSGGTLTFQGYSGGGKMGGTLASRITATEILDGGVQTGADRNASYLVLSTTASLGNERAFTPGTGLSAVDAGANAAYTLNVNDSVVATISGSTFTGAVSFDQGLSGSLTRLTDGTSYLAAGTGVTIASASNGQVVISAPDVGDITGVTAGTGLTGGGTSGTVTLNINDSVVATLTGSVFSGNIVASGSVKISSLTDGRVALVGADGVLGDRSGLTYDGVDLTASGVKVSDLTAGRVTYASTNGKLVDEGGLTYDATDLTMPGAKVSDLTSGRVTYASTGGKLVDDSTLTYDGSDLTVPSAIVSDLTSGRVTFATTSGGLTDSTNLTWDGTQLAVTGTINSIRRYNKNAFDPSESPADGDQYFNTTLGMEMRYDDTRSKWLSTETSEIPFNRQGNTGAGAYYRMGERAMGTNRGRRAEWNGTVVSLTYTQQNTTTTTFEVTSNGSGVATLATGGATSGADVTLDGNFSSGTIIGVKNQSGGASTRHVIGFVRIKWRTT